jgi:hypothetical protein
MISPFFWSIPSHESGRTTIFLRNGLVERLLMTFLQEQYHSLSLLLLFADLLALLMTRKTVFKTF